MTYKALRRRPLMDGWRVQVFYDGDCPLCAKEIALLRRLDRRQRVWFTDIAGPEFDAAADGSGSSMPKRSAMAAMVSRCPGRACPHATKNSRSMRPCLARTSSASPTSRASEASPNSSATSVGATVRKNRRNSGSVNCSHS